MLNNVSVRLDGDELFNVGVPIPKHIHLCTSTTTTLLNLMSNSVACEHPRDRTRRRTVHTSHVATARSEGTPVDSNSSSAAKNLHCSSDCIHNTLSRIVTLRRIR